MAVSVSYPGVYVQEIPSGVRTITGVSTSIAAFIGWAPMGPADAATLVTSFGEYARTFGGLDARSNLGYAVSQFFANGGTQAYIVRLVGADAAAGSAVVGVANKLTLTASSKGDWSAQYGVGTTISKIDPTRFQLVVYRKGEVPGGFKKKDNPIRVEVFDGLSMSKTDPSYVRAVLNAQSAIVRMDADPTATAPPEDPTDPNGDIAVQLTGGAVGTVLDPDPANDAVSKAFVTALHAEALGVGGAGGAGGADGPPARSDGAVLLEAVDLFNLLCIPGLNDPTTIQLLEAYCRARRAFFIVDSSKTATTHSAGTDINAFVTNDSRNAAFYFPWVTGADPRNQNRPRDFPPCGFVAGIYARTDATRGVWKAPAGTEASVVGALGPQKSMTDVENGLLNPKGVNCIRNFATYGTVLWGSRTLEGNDEKGSEWKYIPVKRTALFIEESLFRALKWVVFEPNDEPLWAQIRLNVGAFMHDLFRQGAFQGRTPQEAYFVKCDKETTTQSDINRGIVNVLVGFAPLKPAEFVVVQIQQLAGQVAV